MPNPIHAKAFFSLHTPTLSSGRKSVFSQKPTARPPSPNRTTMEIVAIISSYPFFPYMLCDFPPPTISLGIPSPHLWVHIPHCADPRSSPAARETADATTIACKQFHRQLSFFGLTGRRHINHLCGSHFLDNQSRCGRSPASRLC